MKGSPLKQRDKRSEAVKLESVLDLVTHCPKCGGEIGLWSEEDETLCIFCEYRVFDRERTTH